LIPSLSGRKEAAGSFEMLPTSKKTARCHNPKDYSLEKTYSVNNYESYILKMSITLSERRAW
jgi:hypothetical protein